MRARWLLRVAGAGVIVVGLAGPAVSGGFFGNWFPADGSQSFNSRAVAGAAPNSLATGRGVRCEYRYVVRNGVRERYEFCQ
ncbi:MAG: hypothetical protein BroJett030_05520 [Alphaproteobacteria bacterium]|nr:MAG: hypothetical protein BroJett030_05520 [Alphaproteobacteria bacterium]